VDSRKIVKELFAGETLREAQLVLRAQGPEALWEYCRQWARGHCEARGSGDPRELAKLAQELAEKERSPRD
jgi:hypothetical protein